MGAPELETPDTAFGLARRRAKDQGDAMTWFHFIPASGHDGALWFHRFVESTAEAVILRIEGAVQLLRKGCLHEGLDVIERCAAEKEEIEARYGLEITGALEEGYWGALGYWHYLCGDFDQARAAMARARQAVASTVDGLPFLVMLSQKCRHLFLNEARVARNQHRWPEMWQLIERALGMVRGEVPLCETSRGPVLMEDVYDFLRSIQATDEYEEKALEALLDHERNVAVFEHMAIDASTLPWIGIEYR